MKKTFTNCDPLFCAFEKISQIIILRVFCTTLNCMYGNLKRKSHIIQDFNEVIHYSDYLKTLCIRRKYMCMLNNRMVNTLFNIYIICFRRRLWNVSDFSIIHSCHRIICWSNMYMHPRACWFSVQWANCLASQETRDVWLWEYCYIFTSGRREQFFYTHRIWKKSKR